jgi:hypothetical protein
VTNAQAPPEVDYLLSLNNKSSIEKIEEENKEEQPVEENDFQHSAFEPF